MTVQTPIIHWLFIDMDSYFASAEQHLRPELRGHPVGVIPIETQSTCVIAASIQAKRFGVRTGTRVPDAKRLCPAIRLVRARPDVYVRLHREVATEIDRVIPVCQAYSIDEWSVRLTRFDRDVRTATDIAEAIRARLRTSFSEALTCSVGIAPTRLLAKIACELEKPDGLCLLTTDDLPGRLEHLGLEDLTGIGRSMARRLRASGVGTVRELWDLSERECAQIWGSCVGARWWRGLHGIDEPEQRTGRHSMGHANVLEPRFRTVEGARLMLARLVSRVAVRLRMDGYLARRLDIHVEHAPHTHASPTHAPHHAPHTHARDSRSLPRGFAGGLDLEPTNDTRTLLVALGTIWRRRPGGMAAPLRVGATACGLVPEAGVAMSLFERPRKDDALSHAIDRINRRLGKNTVYFGSMFGCSHEMDEKIAFGRVPEERLC